MPGFREMNVAYGATLHRAGHDLPNTLDHREDESRPEAERYEPVHPVRLEAGGVLAALIGVERRMANSLHGRDIARLAPALTAEAVASDGLIEAATVTGARRFARVVRRGAGGTTPVVRGLCERPRRAAQRRSVQRASSRRDAASMIRSMNAA